MGRYLDNYRRITFVGEISLSVKDIEAPKCSASKRPLGCRPMADPGLLVSEDDGDVVPLPYPPKDVVRMLEILRELVGGENGTCKFDHHHGYCQGHGWFGDPGECGIAEARQLLGLTD